MTPSAGTAETKETTMNTTLAAYALFAPNMTATKPVTGRGILPGYGYGERVNQHG